MPRWKRPTKKWSSLFARTRPGSERPATSTSTRDETPDGRRVSAEGDDGRAAACAAPLVMEPRGAMLSQGGASPRAALLERHALRQLFTRASAVSVAASSAFGP